MYKPKHYVTVLIFHGQSYYELKPKAVCGGFKATCQKVVLRYLIWRKKPKLATERHAKKLFGQFSDRHVRSNDIRYHLRLTHNKGTRHVVGIRVNEVELAKLKELSALRPVVSGQGLTNFQVAWQAIREIQEHYGYKKTSVI